jgi:AcrR family transcriptional regulator
MFSERGYAGTSIRDIAVAVGIRGSSMYNHFGSKEAILWDLTQTALQNLFQAWSDVAALVADQAPEEVLASFVRSNVRYHALHRKEAALINAQLPSLDTAHHREAVRRRADYETILTRLISDCLATGRLEVVDLRLTVYAILQMCAAVAGWFNPEGELTVDQVAEAYARFALKLLAPSTSR